MTIPIARVVATRYADVEPPLRLCYVSRAYRAVRPQRGEAREQLQAGIELVGAAGAAGTAEALTILCRALDAAGPARLPHRARQRGAVPGAARRRRHRARGPRAAAARARHARLRRASSARCAHSARREQLLRDPAAARRHRGPRRRRRRRRRAARGPRRCWRRDAAERVIFDLGLIRDLGYYTGAIFEVYDSALGVPLGGGGRYDDLRRALRAPAARGRLGPRGRARARRPGRGALGMSPQLTIAVPRGALMRDTLDRLDAIGDRHRRGARQRPQAAVPRCGHRHDAPERRPDLRRGRRRRHRRHRQGRPARAVRARGRRAARPRLRAVPDGLRDRGRRGPGRRGAAPARRHARRHQVPEDRHAPLPAHRPPGRDRRGQGLGRARAADRARRGDRRSHRHRHDAAARTAS